MTATPIRLLLSDIDGTLVTSKKVLTAETIRAVGQLREAGVLFAITSSRPPRGLTMYIEPLGLTTPLSAFNGGLVVTPEMKVVEERPLEDDVVAPLLQLLTTKGLSPWLYQGEEWYVLDVDGPHVQHEAEVCQFQPLAVDNFDRVSTRVDKIVGVSDDEKVMDEARDAARRTFGQGVSATSSQTYYLDVTNVGANKGAVVDYLARTLDIPRTAIATIGDAHNDVAMFERAGLSVAMGNAVADVQASATHVTSSNDDDGFANAVRQFILP